VPGLGTADDWRVRMPAMRFGVDGASLTVAVDTSDASLLPRRTNEPLSPRRVDSWIGDDAKRDDDFADSFDELAESLGLRLG
jgi:hypothetical protein